jgi:hypothetical protein
VTSRRDIESGAREPEEPVHLGEAAQFHFPDPFTPGMGRLGLSQQQIAAKIGAAFKALST